MKPFKIILSCALAAGLMTLAADKVQAGVVINNQLYSPLKIKVTIGVYNSKGKITKVSVTSKEVLKMLGYSKDTRLAIVDGMVQFNPIYVIDKDSVLENLTAQGILTADLNELLDNPGSENSNGSFKYSSAGVMSLNFYSNPQFNDSEGSAPDAQLKSLLEIPISDLDQQASRDASDYWFEISGLYSYSEKGSAIKGDSNPVQTKDAVPTGTRNINTMLKAKYLSGMGYDVDLDAEDPTTVSGSVSAKGSGTVPAYSIY